MNVQETNILFIQLVCSNTTIDLKTYTEQGFYLEVRAQND